jgi:hypothetical protein
VAGAIVKLRLDPLPLKTMFVFGIRFVFEELADTTRFDDAVSTSLTVNGIAAVGVSSFVTRFAKQLAEIDQRIMKLPGYRPVGSLLTR